MRAIWILASLFFGTFFCVVSCDVVSFAATPATTPSDPISTWFSDLANRDASVREQARLNLMGISRDDLDKLRKLVETRRPLAPGQAMAIREIVDQVYLATEPYEPMEGAPGFLGVPLSTSQVVVDPGDEDSQLGMVVASRIRGFCAFRYLQDGDVILKVEDHPVRISKDLSDAVSVHHGGDTIQIQVLRGGQKLDVSIKLDARPIWAPQMAVAFNTPDILRERQRKADEYWDKYFAPLLDAGLL
jgi:C-terminal processing protease CtpA/Prc